MSMRALLAAALFVGGLATAQAAPAMPTSGLAGHDMVETVAMHSHHRMHHHRMHRHHSTRHERRMRRLNTMRHGNPNARNPSRPGYQQQLGNTTGGPRY